MLMLTQFLVGFGIGLILVAVAWLVIKSWVWFFTPLLTRDQVVCDQDDGAYRVTRWSVLGKLDIQVYERWEKV